MLSLLMPHWGRYGIHPETSWVHCPCETANYPALACGIPSFQHNHGPFACTKIGLLDCLKTSLHRAQAVIVVGKVNLWMLRHSGQSRSLNNHEVLDIHELYLPSNVTEG